MALHPPRLSHLRRLSSKPTVCQPLKLLLGGISIVVLTTSVTLADYVPSPGSSSPSGGLVNGTRAYNPPSNPSRPASGGFNGTRGLGSCGKASRGKLTALAPVSHIGQTIATHPTFSWYVPDAEPYPIKVRLSSYDSNGKLVPIGVISPDEWTSKPGIMQYTLPPEHAGLTVGQTYRWQVTLICNPSSRSDDQLLRTNFTVVAMPTMLQSALAKTSDRLERAKLYAKAGFWYDALAETLATATPPKTPPFAITLLEDLVQLEPPGTPEKPGQQHNQLKQVVEIQRQ